MVLGTFAAGDLQGRTLTLSVSQVVAGGPAHDEPQLVSAQFPEPGRAGGGDFHLAALSNLTIR